MPLNARVEPGAGQEAIGYNASLAAWQIVAYGVVTFDMADGGDLASIVGGTPKAVEWFASSLAQPGDPNAISVLGELSAFALEFSHYSASASAVEVYDAAAEVQIDWSFTGGGQQICAWVWPTTCLTEGSENYTVRSYHPLMVAYEGVPITPQIYLRSGMLPGVTAADASVTWHFKLLALPQVSAGSQRIRVPEPFCVPPFVGHGTNKGTHIFQGHASKPLPSIQRQTFPRQFRTVAYDTTAQITDPQIDARIFGGPWRGHMMGVSDAGSATASWSVDALLAQAPCPLVLGYTPPPIVGVASSAAASLNTGPESAHDALRFTQFDDTAGGRTEILVEFGDQ